jgi:hypothetical protein
METVSFKAYVAGVYYVKIMNDQFITYKKL